MTGMPSLTPTPCKRRIVCFPSGGTGLRQQAEGALRLTVTQVECPPDRPITQSILAGSPSPWLGQRAVRPPEGGTNTEYPEDLVRGWC